jgi:hypothetical protein
VARRYLYWQAVILLFAACIAATLARGTSDDIRRVGDSSMSGVTVRGCTEVAVGLALGAALFAVSAYRLHRPGRFTRGAALFLEMLFVAMLAVSFRDMFDEPQGIVAWCGLAALGARAIVKLLAHPVVSN